MTPTPPWLARLPAGLFAIPFGLFAFAGAWRRTIAFGWEMSPGISAGVGLLALALLLLLVALYGAKLLRYPQAVRGESNHPLGGPTQALIPLACLMSAVIFGQHDDVRWLVFVLCALILQGVIALRLAAKLARGGLDPQDVSPALYLPPVGGGLVGAMALNAIGYQGFGALLFGMGLASWALLEARVLHRLFDGPLPMPMRPTIGVELAPPAVATLAAAVLWPQLPGDVLLIGLGIAAGPLVAVLLRWDWWSSAPFSAGFWSFSFPLAALASSTVEVVQRGHWPSAVGAVAMALVSMVYVFLVARTLRLLMQGRLIPVPSAPPPPAAAPAAR